MKNLFRPAAAVAALSIALGGGVAVTRNNANDAPPIPSTLALAKGLCGKGDGLANRRAFFVRAAQAYAAELTPEMKRPSLMPHSDYIGFKITTEKPEAQAWFDQGLGHMFNFNHAEAIKSFQ